MYSKAFYNNGCGKRSETQIIKLHTETKPKKKKTLSVCINTGVSGKHFSLIYQEIFTNASEQKENVVDFSKWTIYWREWNIKTVHSEYDNVQMKMRIAHGDLDWWRFYCSLVNIQLSKYRICIIGIGLWCGCWNAHIPHIIIGSMTSYIFDGIDNWSNFIGC